MKFRPRLTGKATPIGQLTPAPQKRGPGFKLEGAYSREGYYTKDVSIVKFDGGSWVAQKSGFLDHPDFRNNDWQCLAQRGAPGKSINDDLLKGYVEDQARKLAKEYYEELAEEMEITGAIAVKNYFEELVVFES